MSEKCEHEWYWGEECRWVIRRQVFIYCAGRWEYNEKYVNKENPKAFFKGQLPEIVSFAHRMVCTKCGECVDEINEAFDQIEARWEEEEKHEEIGKRLYEECFGKKRSAR